MLADSVHVTDVPDVALDPWVIAASCWLVSVSSERVKSQQNVSIFLILLESILWNNPAFFAFSSVVSQPQSDIVGRHRKIYLENIFIIFSFRPPAFPCFFVIHEPFPRDTDNTSSPLRCNNRCYLFIYNSLVGEIAIFISHLCCSGSYFSCSCCSRNLWLLFITAL